MNVKQYYNSFPSIECSLLKEVSYELSYRIPKRILTKRLIGDYTFPVCPRCQNTLDREFQSYCDRCGQMLCWKRYGKMTPIEFPQHNCRQTSLFELWL